MLGSALWRSIIYRYVPRRGPFDKTNFIENHESWKYVRPQRQAKWEDEQYNWPPQVPAYTEHTGKHLIKQLEREYMQIAKPSFPVPDFRTGDELEIENLYSVSGGKFSTFRGLCIARRNWQHLHASFNVIGSRNGMTLEVSMKLFSPLLRSVKVMEYGAGNLRARLNYFRDLATTKFPALKKGKGWRQRAVFQAREEAKQKRQKLQEDTE